MCQQTHKHKNIATRPQSTKFVANTNNNKLEINITVMQFLNL